MAVTENLDEVFNIAKKSIFKQSTFRNLYGVGEVERRPVFSPPYTVLKIIEESEFIKEEVLYTCNLQLPVLNVNEKFYISELDKTVVIKERIRASDNSYMYVCDDIYIDDEKSLESREKAKEERQKYMDEIEIRKKLSILESHWLLGKLMKVFKL